MPRLYIYTALFCFFAILPATAQDTMATAKADLEKLTHVFPKLYWYASDACMRETSRVRGQLDTPKGFANKNRAEIEKIEEGELEGNKVIESQVRLHDPSEPDEYWIFVFVYRNGAWATHTAYKYFGKNETFDLYKAEFFMGSMRPYIDKGLDAFVHGQDFATIYKTKET